MAVRKKHPGIVERHSRGCRGSSGGRCSCEPTYEAWLSVKGEEGFTKVRKTFPRLSEAKAWRIDAQAAQNHGRLPRPSKLTVAEALLDWIDGAKEGRIRNRSGLFYKPSSLRGYEQAITGRIVPSELGRMRASEVRRMDVQDFADGLLAEGLTGGTVANILNPLQAVYRRLIRREIVSINPTVDIELPKDRKKRDRILSPAESLTYIEALPIGEQALWATAFYAGLRRGELKALRVCDVDLAKNELHVLRSWDQYEKAIDPKSDAGRRTVPIVAILRDHLDGHIMRSGREGDDLVFGRTRSEAFVASTARSRARKAWLGSGLDPVRLHECRHTAASMLIDAGINNPKAIMEFMGHSTITETYDRYGHLMPGSRNEVRSHLDAYMASALKRTSIDACPAG